MDAPQSSTSDPNLPVERTLPRELPKQALQITESDDTAQYVRNVHSGFALKLLELHTLAQRLEPQKPYISVTGKRTRPAPRPTDIRHVLRRWDLSLMRVHGFPYNTQRAFFHRDPGRSGRLLFPQNHEAGLELSLLGTRPEDDRFVSGAQRQGEVTMETLSEQLQGQRIARIEAFFAMFERRQAIAGNASLAPPSLFIGDRTIPFEERLAFFRRRAPLLPQHRYNRLCVVARLKNIHSTAVILAERAMEGDTSIFDLHILSPEPMHAQDDETLARDVYDYWVEYIIDGDRRHPPIFSTTITTHFRLVKNETWPMVLPTVSDPEFIYRLGMLLEMPKWTGFSPWNTSPQQRREVGERLAYGSLNEIIQASPVPGGLFLVPPQSLQQHQPSETTLANGSPEDWLVVTLMMRVYPYMLLANREIQETFDKEETSQDRPQFTAEERARFRDLIVDNRPPQVSGSRVPQRLAKQKPIGAKKKKRKQDIEIRRVDSPTTGRSGDPSIEQFVTSPPRVSNWSDAEDARFIALRRAQEATQNQEPLLALKGWSPARDGYANAKRWRQKILGSPEILRTLSEQCLAFLYGRGGGNAWAYVETQIRERPEAFGTAQVPRLAWEDRLEDHTPKLGTDRYAALLKRQPAMKAPSSEQERVQLLSTTTSFAPNPNNGLWWLMATAVGVAPTESIQRQVELEFVMSAVLASMAKDALLLFAPETHTDIAGSTNGGGGSALRSEITGRLAQIRTEGLSIADWIVKHPITTKTLAAFALLSWEWGKTRGLRRFASWLDRLWNANTTSKVLPAGQKPSRIITRVLTHHFPLFRELFGTPLRAPPPPPTKMVPNPTIAETEARQVRADKERSLLVHHQALIRFVEQMYGYREGDLDRRFGEVADGKIDANTLKNIARVGVELGGAGRHPWDRQPSTIYIGWKQDEVGVANLNALSLRYYIIRGSEEEEVRESGTIAARPRFTLRTRKRPSGRNVSNRQHTPISEHFNTDYVGQVLGPLWNSLSLQDGDAYIQAAEVLKMK